MFEPLYSNQTQPISLNTPGAEKIKREGKEKNEQEDQPQVHKGLAEEARPPPGGWPGWFGLRRPH